MRPAVVDAQPTAAAAWSLLLLAPLAAAEVLAALATVTAARFRLRRVEEGRRQVPVAKRLPGDRLSGLLGVLVEDAEQQVQLRLAVPANVHHGAAPRRALVHGPGTGPTVERLALDLRETHGRRNFRWNFTILNPIIRSIKPSKYEKSKTELVMSCCLERIDIRFVVGGTVYAARSLYASVGTIFRVVAC